MELGVEDGNVGEKITDSSPPGNTTWRRKQLEVVQKAKDFIAASKDFIVASGS